MKNYLEIYLNFPGTTKKAMEFYGSVFNSSPNFVYFKDMPDPTGDFDASHLPDDAVANSDIKIGDFYLMASDDFEGKPVSYEGFTISYSVTDDEEVKRIWQAFLEAGSEVIMPLAPTFWASQYGILTDPFGVPWMIQNFDRDARAE